MKRYDMMNVYVQEFRCCLRASNARNLWLILFLSSFVISAYLQFLVRKVEREDSILTSNHYPRLVGRLDPNQS